MSDFSLGEPTARIQAIKQCDGSNVVTVSWAVRPIFLTQGGNLTLTLSPVQALKLAETIRAAAVHIIANE